jgi:hypothetical protein
MSVNVMRIKATSHLVTLNHFDPDLGILKRQQALDGRQPPNLSLEVLRDQLPVDWLEQRALLGM